MKGNNNNSTQKQINKMHYENYLRKQLYKIESKTTQILNDSIKTSDLGLVTLALLNHSELSEISNEPGIWSIEKNKQTEELYRKYKNKEAIVDPLTYSRTLENLITKEIKNYA